MKRILCIMLMVSTVVLPCIGLATEESLLIDSGSHDDFSLSLRVFQEEHPDITLAFDTAPDINVWLVDQIIQQNDQFDVYRLSSNTNLSSELISRKYCEKIPLSQEQEKKMASFYPAIIERLFYEGDLYFVPTAIKFPYVFSVNTDLLAEVGISIYELPNNLVSLFDFIKLWNEEYSSDYPEITPFYAFGFGYIGLNDMVGLLMEVYKDSQLLAGETLKFDTNVFRVLMKEVQTYTLPHKERTGKDIMFDTPQISECLIYCEVANTRNILTRSDNPFFPFSLELAFVNPYSNHKESANLLLQSYLNNPDEYLLCTISEKLAAPVESPKFVETKAQWIANIEDAKARLEEATPAEEYELRDTITTMQYYLDNEDAYKYKVSEEKILEYKQTLAPYLAARGKTLFDTHLINDNIETLIRQYLEGAMEIEELVRELDRKVDMLYKEDAVN